MSIINKANQILSNLISNDFKIKGACNHNDGIVMYYEIQNLSDFTGFTQILEKFDDRIKVIAPNMDIISTPAEIKIIFSHEFLDNFDEILRTKKFEKILKKI